MTRSLDNVHKISVYSTAFVVETTLHVKNTSSQLWFRVEFETRPRPFFGAFGLYKLVEKALGTRLPLGVPMGTNGILSFLRIWLMIIEICEYERHLIFRRDSSLVQLVTFSIFSCFFSSIWQVKDPPFQIIDFFLTIHRQSRLVQVLQRPERMEMLRHSEHGSEEALLQKFGGCLTCFRKIRGQLDGGHKVKGRAIARLEIFLIQLRNIPTRGPFLEAPCNYRAR